MWHKGPSTWVSDAITKHNANIEAYRHATGQRDEPTVPDVLQRDIVLASCERAHKDVVDAIDRQNVALQQALEVAV